VRQIVVAMTNHHLERIQQTFRRLLAVIDEARDSRIVRLRKDGTVIDVGPDHYARMAAVGQFIKLLTAGRPTARRAYVREAQD
jgi:hypothetical protein